jgi:hypothetical protein
MFALERHRDPSHNTTSTPNAGRMIYPKLCAKSFKCSYIHVHDRIALKGNENKACDTKGLA